MTDHPYRGPAAWMRANAFILILAGAVAVALVGDRVARSGVNPADNPQFAQAAPAGAPADTAEAGQKSETPPSQPPAAEPQQQAETPAAAPVDGTGANGGSGQESTATSQPDQAATDKATSEPGGEAPQNAAPPPETKKQ